MMGCPRWFVAVFCGVKVRLALSGRWMVHRGTTPLISSRILRPFSRGMFNFMNLRLTTRSKLVSRDSTLEALGTVRRHNVRWLLPARIDIVTEHAHYGDEVAMLSCDLNVVHSVHARYKCDRFDHT